MNIQELIGNAVSGNTAAAAGIYDAYKNNVYYLCLRLVGGNEDAAAGMLQSAFMHIYGKLGLLKDPASFPAWSYMTAAKRCRSYLSGSGRTVDFSRLAATLPDDAGDKKSFPYSLGGSRSELVGDADACRAVEEAVCALPEAERFAVMLFFFCGLDPDQIARNLQADPRSVRRAIISGAGLVGAEIKKRTKDTPALSKFRGAAELGAILSERAAAIRVPERVSDTIVAETVLPIISEMQGARIESCELTDTRMYIKVVNERIQTEVVPGDIVQAGILISNSEVGMGSVSVKPLIYRLVCTNGMVADVGVGKRHVGRINESVDGDFGIFRDETIEADDRAFLMKIEDTVRAAVDEARFNALVQKLRDAKEAPILPAAAPKVVELAAKEFNIRQNESEGILGHLIAGGDLSLYGLANAVTRHAQDVQSYDRSTELEATGYKIITMQPSLLKRWNEEVSIV